MARRAANQQRATDRLNVALTKITVAAEMVLDVGAPQDEQKRVAMREQIEQAKDEAYAALGDIRHAVGAI